MTKGQRALLDLTMMLDSLGVEHPDIIQGWLNSIRAELERMGTSPRCPECHTKIDFLFEYEKAEVRYTFTVDRAGRSCSHQHDVFSDELIGYECPECGKRLFEQEADAINFLVGHRLKRNQT